MNCLKPFFLAPVFAASLAGMASAASLTFDGPICNGICTNDGLIDQSYGDIAGQLDVIYDGNRNTTAAENLRFWTTGYESLVNVAFGEQSAGGLSILLQPLSGYKVTLTGFDIAPYANRVRNTLVQIIDTATGTFLKDDAYTPLSTTGITQYSGSWMSASGLQINLGPDAWDVAIDNVNFSVAQVSAVPLPAAGWLLGGALAGFAALRRRS